MTVCFVCHNILRSILGGIAFALLSLVATAQAGTIFTPMIIVEKDGVATCIANNAHTAPVTVTVKLLSSINEDASKTCTLPVGDDKGCEAAKTFTRQVGARCQISIDSLSNASVAERLRGILFYRKFHDFAVPAIFVVRAR